MRMYKEINPFVCSLSERLTSSWILLVTNALFASEIIQSLPIPCDSNCCKTTTENVVRCKRFWHCCLLYANLFHDSATLLTASLRLNSDFEYTAHTEVFDSIYSCTSISQHFLCVSYLYWKVVCFKWYKSFSSDVWSVLSWSHHLILRSSNDKCVCLILMLCFGLIYSEYRVK